MVVQFYYMFIKQNKEHNSKLYNEQFWSQSAQVADGWARFAIKMFRIWSWSPETQC